MDCSLMEIVSEWRFLLIDCSSVDCTCCAARLNSILWVTAGLDVKELPHEVHLNARCDDDNEDLNNRPGADVALVVLQQGVVTRLKCPRVRLELVPERRCWVNYLQDGSLIWRRVGVDDPLSQRWIGCALAEYQHCACMSTVLFNAVKRLSSLQALVYQKTFHEKLSDF